MATSAGRYRDVRIPKEHRCHRLLLRAHVHRSEAGPSPMVCTGTPADLAFSEHRFELSEAHVVHPIRDHDERYADIIVLVNR